MNTYQRKFHIDRLADEIGYVGQNFELFGGLFLNLVLEIPVNSQGINLQGFPVAGVVDGVTPDGLIAVEYSAQKNYFESPMRKAESDVAHVLERAPNAVEIYLLSGRRRRPQIAQDFELLIAGWPSMANRTLHLLGAEEIATAIVDKGFLNDEAVRQLAPYLPTLKRLADEEAAEALVPAPDSRRLRRPEIDAELHRRLDEERCVAIGGLAGIGKSDAAAAFVENRKDAYQNIIWLSGGVIERIEDLSAVVISKVGESRNVAALLKSRRCLLVIDDAHRELATNDLALLCGHGSHVLMTRRIVAPSDFELPMFDKHDSLRLLNRDAPQPCPDDIFDVLWATVGGHPLSLGLMNAAVIEGSTWHELGQDCRGIGTLESANQILADRLLSRLRRALENELSIFEWAGQSRCDRGFFLAASTPSGLRKLKSNGLIAADRSSVVRLHDIVFASLSAQNWWTQSRQASITASLEHYLSLTAQDNDLTFWATVTSMRQVIRRLVQADDRRPAFLYALLSLWSPVEIDLALASDPVVEANSLKVAGLPVPPIATMALMEAVEQLFLRDKRESHDIARERLSRRMVVFDDLGSISGFTPKQTSEIKHHKAKALVRLRRAGEAISLFEEVLAGPFPLVESRIQLMRILGHGDEAAKSRAAEIADQILSTPSAEGGVSHSVFLAAVEQLPWRTSGELIFKHQMAIEKLIVEAANLGIPQAFRTLASISRYLSREAPELLMQILAALPQRTLNANDEQGDRATWADILLEASRKGGDSSQKMQAEALLFFEGEFAAEPFHKQRHAELLLLMDRAQDAKMLLSRRSDLDTGAFAQRLMALTELRLGNAGNALIWIDRALFNLKNKRYVAEFHEHRFDIRRELGDIDAIDDLKKAVEYSDSGHTKLRLQEKLTTCLPDY